jgi:hypothetical protein
VKRHLRAEPFGQQVPDRTTEEPFYGIELDGILLPLAEALDSGLPSPDQCQLGDLPFFSSERAVVISGRSERSRMSTLQWLTENGHAALPIELRPLQLPDNPAMIAQYKAETASRWGCTHFVESNPEQALRIAARAPHLIVSWWSSADKQCWVVSATATPPRIGKI